MSEKGSAEPKLKWLDATHRRSKDTKAQERRVARKVSGRSYSGSGSKYLSDTARVHASAKIAPMQGESGEVRTAIPRARSSNPRTPKGDMYNDKLHLEHKRTRCASISLKKEWLRRTQEGARRVRKVPGVIITFEGDAKGITVKDDDWLLLPLDDAVRLMELDDE